MQEAIGNEINDKNLSFTLGKETYGLEILKVREIIGMLPITPLPQTPFFIKGVINLRGKIIAVMDLKNKFGLTETEQTSESCMIIVDIGTKQMGLIVDSVKEVVDIPTKNIEKTPSLGLKINSDFIRGIGKLASEIVILLNIDKILTSEEFVSLDSI